MENSFFIASAYIVMSHSMMILYFHLSNFRASDSALFFTQYLCAFHLDRRSLLLSNGIWKISMLFIYCPMWCICFSEHVNGIRHVYQCVAAYVYITKLLELLVNGCCNKDYGCCLRSTCRTFSQFLRCEQTGCPWGKVLLPSRQV